MDRPTDHGRDRDILLLGRSVSKTQPNPARKGGGALLNAEVESPETEVEAPATAGSALLQRGGQRGERREQPDT